MLKLRLWLGAFLLLVFTIIFKMIPTIIICFFWVGFREFRRGGFGNLAFFIRAFPTLTIQVYRANYERICREHERRRNLD